MPPRAPSPQTRLLRFNAAARRLLHVAVAASFAAVVCAVGQGYVLSQAVDRVFLQHKALPAVTPLLAVLLALAVGRAVVTWLSDVLAQRAANTLKGDLRARLTEHVLRLGPAYTRGESSGELVHAAVEGVEALDDFITVFQPARLLAMLAPVFVFFVVLKLDPPTTLVLLFTGPMLLIILALIGSRTREITERRYRELSWMSAFFLDMLQGMTTLKLFGRSREQIENIRRISRSYGNTTLDVLQTAFQSAFVLEFGGTVATALVAVEVSLRLMNGGLPFSNALAVLIITPEFFVPLRQYALRYHAGANGRAAAERIFAIIDAPAPARASAAVARTTAPMRGDIVFDNVSLAYAGGARPALRGFSLRMAEGTSTALVGATGAGKTTAASLLLRFVAPDAGSITVGGVPLDTLDVAAWRAHVAWVPQRPHLFYGTVAENIGLAQPGATRQQIVAAATAAHAHDFIQALPAGYDTHIGEQAARLSGGQMQRVAIARAFLKNAPILILDEATSYLDAASEAAIADALARLMRGRTVLIIAHRLALVYGVDQVVVMENGRAVASGGHDDLLRGGGLYRQLVAAYDGGAL